MNLETIKSKLQTILIDKSSGITPEAQKKVNELVKRIEDLLSNSDGACDIPDEVIKEIARCLVPDIIAFFETEEAKREFEAWKLEQEKKKRKRGDAEMSIASHFLCAVRSNIDIKNKSEPIS